MSTFATKAKASNKMELGSGLSMRTQAFLSLSLRTSQRLNLDALPSAAVFLWVASSARHTAPWVVRETLGLPQYCPFLGLSGSLGSSKIFP
jgi:hypothetical protein